jgi:hypothetical protein
MKLILIFLFVITNEVLAEESVLKKKSFAEDVNRFSSSQKVETSSGQSSNNKLSDRYKATFEKLLQMNTPLANNALEACNTLINASLDLESGAITQEQFESIKRKAMILWNTPTSEGSKDSKPSVEYREVYIQEPAKKSLNCSSTTSGNTVYTNCN